MHMTGPEDFQIQSRSEHVLDRHYGVRSTDLLYVNLPCPSRLAIYTANGTVRLTKRNYQGLEPVTEKTVDTGDRKYESLLITL